MKIIAGVDEAGRGPLAGPVVSAAVILDPLRPIKGLADSKTLSEKKRRTLFEDIKNNALSWAVGLATVEEIDRLNILNAALLSMKRAVEELHVTPDEVWVDGNRLPNIDVPAQCFIKGDQKFEVIGAASIVAKVTRDAMMSELDQQYPRYEFGRHKGYPTKIHLQAIKQYGVLDVHRRSFAPIKQVLVEHE